MAGSLGCKPNKSASRLKPWVYQPNLRCCRMQFCVTFSCISLCLPLAALLSYFLERVLYIKMRAPKKSRPTRGGAQKEHKPLPKKFEEALNNS